MERGKNMLLDSNTKKVIDLLQKFDNLSEIDKIRLALYLIENKNFNTNFNIRDITILLKSILSKLDDNYNKVITNFSKYNHLVFFSTKYLEFSELEKKHFSIEMLFDIYETNFNNNYINKEIKNNLSIFEYCYSLLY